MKILVRNVITKKYPQINRAFLFGSFVENTNVTPALIRKFIL